MGDAPQACSPSQEKAQNVDKLAHGKRKTGNEKKIVIREPISAVPSR